MQTLERSASTSSSVYSNGGPGPSIPGAAQTHANIQQSSEFRKRASGIGAGIQQTAQNLLKLQQLIKRTGKFDDPAVEIARLSDLIKQDIQALNVGLVDLQNLSATAKATNSQSKGHSTTIVDSLRLRLKDATKDFQNVLQTRKENLERNRARQQQFSSATAPDRQPLFNAPRPAPAHERPAFGQAAGAASSSSQGAPMPSQQLFAGGGFSDRSSSGGPHEVGGSTEQCVPALPPGPVPEPALRFRSHSTGARHRASSDEPADPRQPLLQQEQQMVVRQDAYLTSRASAMQNVESTIHELGGIFQQLAHMVQEQGELTIRIDENIDDTLANVDSAQAQLLKYMNSISSNRWLVMKVFGVLLFFLFVFIFFIA
ncbi:g8057 [Coccomyxa viridis]|uniref:G8057 protein n=1 Tax=Coccomyxa viridis TaxID=1274662 RepID=A0ABP1FZE6_9CHLO